MVHADPGSGLSGARSRAAAKSIQMKQPLKKTERKVTEAERKKAREEHERALREEQAARNRTAIMRVFNATKRAES